MTADPSALSTHDPTRLAAAHLHLRLNVLNRACRRALRSRGTAPETMQENTSAGRDATSRLAGLLRDIDRAAQLDDPPDGGCGLTEDDRRAEARLREAAAHAGVDLPLDRLIMRFGLSELDQLTLIAIAAAEFDPAYGRLYAQLMDDAAPGPTVATILAITDGLEDRHHRRMALGPHGCLRRHGIVFAHAAQPGDIVARLALATGVLDVLLGSGVDAGLLGCDPGEVSDAPTVVRAAEWQRLTPIVEALLSGVVDVIGLWGMTEPCAEPWVRTIGSATGFRIRRAPTEDWSDTTWSKAFLEAGFLDALLWVPLDRLEEETRPRAMDELGRVLAATEQPVLVTAREPWRHPSAITVRRFAEHTLPDLSTGDRAALWHLATDGRITPDDAERLGRRWHLDPGRVRAATTIADVASTVTGTTIGPAELDRAAATITAASSGRLVTAVRPRRGPDQLVLPPDVHAQVIELSQFARALPEVCERWGFGRLMSAGTGFKALFAGEPGTGKTLAAEVIAGLVSAQLLRVDLSQVVSKWVGETSKHVEQIFNEAGDGRGVLFFDEADALFGKRGEVVHGTDRYANTEVSHLLQRFEQYDGLVILATNLRENIDPAFIRRFDTVTYFPRPTEVDRRRLWRLSFPPEAPLDDTVDLDLLATLDLTGAGIAAAARMAGLLALAGQVPRIEMGHVLAGVRRQFRTEGRVLSLDELGPFAASSNGAA